MKVKLVNKYDTYKAKEGIYQRGESITDKSQAEDADIYKCIEKYGITTLVRESMAKEPLYIDNTQKMSLADAVRTRNEMDEYFSQLPARVRKTFGDNTEIFYQKYKAGDFNDFLNTGILTEEQINCIRIAGGENEINFREMENVDNISTTDNISTNTTLQDAERSV